MAQKKFLFQCDTHCVDVSGIAGMQKKYSPESPKHKCFPENFLCKGSIISKSIIIVFNTLPHTYVKKMRLKNLFHSTKLNFCKIFAL